MLDFKYLNGWVAVWREQTVYFDLALIFLLFRFSLRIRFFLHLALIVVPLALAVARLQKNAHTYNLEI